MTNGNPDSDDNYRIEYQRETTNFLSSRRITTQAAFFLPYIQPGMKLFETGDVTNLHFPNEHFDAAFVHGVNEYRDAEHALPEIYRVLKIGGVVGSRHGDWGGFLIVPESRELMKFIELFTKFLEHSGGDPHCGRNQLAAVRRAGFSPIKVSASYDCWTENQEAARSAANTMARYCHSPEFADPIIKLGFTDRWRLEEIGAALTQWGENEDAFAAEAWGEAVAWKPP